MEHARQHEAEPGAHTAVLAPYTNRFVHNLFYHSKANPDATPTKAESRTLLNLTGDVPMLTYLNPSMPLRGLKRRRTKWGQAAKGRKAGGDRKPEYKKRLRQEKLHDVLRLHEMGVSLSCIEWWTGVKRTTAWTWIKNAQSAV